MPSISAVAEGLRRASPMALRLMAARSDITLTGKTDEQLIAEIMKSRGIEETPPAPPAPPVRVRVPEAAKIEPQRAPVGRHSFLLGPGEKPEVVSSKTVEKAAAAVEAERAADKYSFLVGQRQKPAEVKPLAPVPRREITLVSPKKSEVAAAKLEAPVLGRFACLLGPGEKPEVVSAELVKPVGAPTVVVQPKVAAKKAPAPASKWVVAPAKAGVPASGRYAFLGSPGEAPAAVAPVVPALPVEAKPKPKAVAPVAVQKEEPKRDDRYYFLTGGDSVRSKKPVPVPVPAALEKKPVEVKPPEPYNAAKELGRYSFLLGPGEVPDKVG